jgi:hypothetical protein
VTEADYRPPSTGVSVRLKANNGSRSGFERLKKFAHCGAQYN